MKPYVRVATDYLEGQFLNTTSKELSEFPTDDCHLAWMLEEIVLEYMSETKANRWLGYVQGVLVCKGYLDVGKERERTRNIFKGA